MGFMIPRSDFPNSWCSGKGFWHQGNLLLNLIHQVCKCCTISQKSSQCPHAFQKPGTKTRFCHVIDLHLHPHRCHLLSRQLFMFPDPRERFFCCSPLICPVNRWPAGGEPTLPNSVNISTRITALHFTMYVQNTNSKNIFL